MADRDFAEEKGRVNNSDPDNRPLFPAPEEPHAATEERGAEAVDNALWETQLFQTYKGTASLRYPHLEPGEVTTHYTLEPKDLRLQEDVYVVPDAVQISAYHTKEREGVVFTALGGRGELAFAGEAGECQGNEACLCPSEISFSGAGISGRQVSLWTRCERSAVWPSGNRQD